MRQSRQRVVVSMHVMCVVPGLAGCRLACASLAGGV